MFLCIVFFFLMLRLPPSSTRPAHSFPPRRSSDLNGAIDAVAKEWVSIAQQTRAAVSLTHHVRKPNGSEPSAHDARGASAMVNAARSVLVFQRMNKEVAQEFQIPECDRKRFFSVYDDRNNKAPAASRAEWYEFVGIGLGNGDDTGPEDNIGAVQRW